MLNVSRLLCHLNVPKIQIVPKEKFVTKENAEPKPAMILSVPIPMIPANLVYALENMIISVIKLLQELKDITVS